MSFTIAIAGKGGVGKTTVAALLVRLLSEKKAGSVLAIDADPNSNLAEVLGVPAAKTVGEILDEISAHPESVPAGMSKDRFIEFQVQTAVAEAGGFDILSMGRPEGPGCYCFVNNVLRNAIGRLTREYDYVVIDNEAGLEHLSRRTTRAAELLLVVSDATVVGLKAASRIDELSRELKIQVKRRGLILNRIADAQETGAGAPQLSVLARLPSDEQVYQLSVTGASIFNLAPSSTALRALEAGGDVLWRS